MRDRHEEIARQLAAFGEQDPPAALRGRALGAARAEWERPADRWLALWKSRPLRLAWAAAVVVLAAANVAVRSTAPTGMQARRAPAARPDASSRELRAIVALPRLRPEYASAFSARSTATIPAPTNPRSEDKS